MAISLSRFCGGSAGGDVSADGVFFWLMYDLRTFIFSVPEFYVIENVVVLPGHLSQLFVALHIFGYIGMIMWVRVARRHSWLVSLSCLTGMSILWFFHVRRTSSIVSPSYHPCVGVSFRLFFTISFILTNLLFLYRYILLLLTTHVKREWGPRHVIWCVLGCWYVFLFFNA